MKKTIYLLAIILGGITFSNAQVSFKPGIRGGLNFSHFTNGNNGYYDPYYYDSNQVNRNFETVTSLYIGVFGDLKFSKFYSLQPELNYSSQGSTLNDVDKNNVRYTTDYNLSYLSIGLANKFTFKKFNFHVGPTIDFLVDSKITGNYSNNYDNNNYIGWDGTPVDFAFFLGAGYDITKNFGVEARIKKGIIPAIDTSYGNHTNVVFSAGAFYKFDVK